MKTISWTCVLALGVSVAWIAPAQATLDNDGTAWSHSINFDQAPDSAATVDADGTRHDGWTYWPNEAGWGVQNAADVWTFSNGIGEMRGPASGNAYSWYGIPKYYGGTADEKANAFQAGAEEGFTIEWRLKVNQASNDTQQRIGINLNTRKGTGSDPYGLQLFYSDQPDVGNGSNQIVNRLAQRGNVSTPATYATPVHDGNFHTYRLTLDAADLSGGQPASVNGKLYVDDNPTPLATDWGIPTAAGDATGRIDIGYISGSPGSWLSADWDFVRAHPGATPAVPEPAALALVAMGALGLIRRRQ
jgi:MYXO-CTERM domain-containing protein